LEFDANPDKSHLIPVISNLDQVCLI